MKKYYKDFYGFTASIGAMRNGMFRLIIKTRYGKSVLNKECKSQRSARLTMSKYSDCWQEKGENAL